MSRRRQFGKALVLGTLLACVCTLGCGSDDKTAKRSHFEHDHHVVAHWPQSLADVSRKIRSRLDSLSPSGKDAEEVGKEISDLIDWAPEIAADTDLSEQDWLPIYHESKSLSKELPTLDADLSFRDRIRVLRFCRLIDNSVPKSILQKTLDGAADS